MKNKLMLLICLTFVIGLNMNCRQEGDKDDLIISNANNIINSYNQQPNFACSSPDDAILYPNPWTKEASDSFIIPASKLESISTCGLIQTFFNQPWNKMGPWCSICSDHSINGIQYFNDKVKQNIVLNKLFSREDALAKLIGRYIYYIQNLKSISANPGYLYSYEILLSSDVINTILTDSTTNELMVLAMKMMEVKKGINEFNNDISLSSSRHIITNLLIRRQFKPFLSACLINNQLETNLMGYKVCYDGSKVENFAKMYLAN